MGKMPHNPYDPSNPTQVKMPHLPVHRDPYMAPPTDPWTERIKAFFAGLVDVLAKIGAILSPVIGGAVIYYTSQIRFRVDSPR